MTPILCDGCGRPFPAGTGQVLAADTLCGRCIAGRDDDDDDLDSTPEEAVYEVPLADPRGNEQARVDAGYDIGGEA